MVTSNGGVVNFVQMGMVVEIGDVSGAYGQVQVPEYFRLQPAAEAYINSMYCGFKGRK
jgi:DNA-directed RNA polymerase subunit E'/Rpb7